MSIYDGTSSSEDELDVQTNVVLGYASLDNTGDEVSQLGGNASWLNENIRPVVSMISCKVCGGYMSLLVLLQADLQVQFPGDQRRLHLWTCRRRQCSRKQGSIRAFREVQKARAIAAKQSVTADVVNIEISRNNLGNQLFGVGNTSHSIANANPFSSTPSSTTSSNPFAVRSTVTANGSPNSIPAIVASTDLPSQSFADKLKISDTSGSPAPPSDLDKSDLEKWPSPSLFPTPFPRYNLDAEPEYLEPIDPTTNALVSSSSRITELDDDSSASSAAVEKDLYESPHDKTFQHFTKVLGQNPEQVLRYEFDGQPLLYSSSDAVSTCFILPGHISIGGSQSIRAGPVKGIPLCDNCGGKRVLELQLTPHLIFELEKEDEDAMKLDGTGMEWGTVLLGTCSRNCGLQGNISFHEEWVGVQWEEVVARRAS